MFLNTKKNLTLSILFLISTLALLYGQNILTSLERFFGVMESREWSAAEASDTIAPFHTLSFIHTLSDPEDEFIENSRVIYDADALYLSTRNTATNTSGIIAYDKQGGVRWHTSALTGSIISNPLINKNTGLIYANSPKGLSIFDKKGIVIRENSCYDTGIPDNSPSFDNDGNILMLNPFATSSRLIDICSPDGTLKTSYLMPSPTPTTTTTTTITSLTPTPTPSEHTALLSLSNEDTTARSQFTSDPLPEWKYKKALMINNLSNTQTLTDYQVSLILDTRPLITQEKMSKDCADMRFLDSDGITILPYWIETGCNTSATKVWIKVPTIPASSTKSISLYYGNEGATESSSQLHTFIRRIEGLSGAWSFDEMSGSTVNDSSGNNDRGTFYWNIPAVVDGKFNKAREFLSTQSTRRNDGDARTQFMQSSLTSKTNIINNFTMEAWVYPYEPRQITNETSCGTQGAGRQKFVFFPQQLGVGFGNCSEPDGLAGAGFSVGTNGVSVVEHASNFVPTLLVHSISLSGWNHIVVVYKNKIPSLYINGSFIKSGLASIPNVFPTNIIGDYTSYGPFDGMIDEAKIYNRPLESEEVFDIANNQLLLNPTYPSQALVRKHSSPEPTTQIYGVGEIVIDQNNIAYANLYTTGFTAIRSTDGTMIWSNPSVSGRSVVALSPDEKTVYTVGNGDTLYALDTTDGHELWHTVIGFDDPALTVHPTTGTIYVSHAKDTTGNADTSMIYALTPGEGSLLWKYQTKAEITGVSFGLNENGALYFLDPESGMITALDTEKGTLLWTYASDARNNNEITSDPETGAIYISAHQTLYGLTPWITEIRAKQDKRSIHFTVETTMLQRDPSASQDNLVQIKLTSPKAVTIPLSYTKEEDGKTYWEGSYMPPKNTNTKNTTYEGTVEEASYKTTTTQQTHFEKLPDGFENVGKFLRFKLIPETGRGN